MFVKLFKEYGVKHLNGYNVAMCFAGESGHTEIVKICKEWGATWYYDALYYAAENGHDEIVKLCREWLGFWAIHNELYQYHHKKKYFKSLHEELIAIAWHPDRYLDWCVDEDEKTAFKKRW